MLQFLAVSNSNSFSVEYVVFQIHYIMYLLLPSQCPNAKHLSYICFFLAFQVPPETNEIVLTEGEYDAMAVYQVSDLLFFAPFCF